MLSVVFDLLLYRVSLRWMSWRQQNITQHRVPLCWLSLFYCQAGAPSSL